MKEGLLLLTRKCWPITSSRLASSNLLDVIGQLNGYLQDVIGRPLPIYRMRLVHSTRKCWPITSSRLASSNLLDVIGRLNGYLQDVIGRPLPIYRMWLVHSTENVSLITLGRLTQSSLLRVPKVDQSASSKSKCWPITSIRFPNSVPNVLYIWMVCLIKFKKIKNSTLLPRNNSRNNGTLEQFSTN